MYQSVAGEVPGQGAYGRQLIDDVSLSHPCFCLSVSVSLSLKSISISSGKD